MKRGQQIFNLLPYFCGTFKPKEKRKTVGFALQQRHFLCGDKANEAKKSLALRLAGRDLPVLLLVFNKGLKRTD
jgi:hypothetical protein